MQKYPDADLRVYAVWLNILISDDRSSIPPILIDSRATEFWDGELEVARWFPKHEAFRDSIFRPIAWDVWLLFGPEAEWDAIPGPLLSGGSPITSSLEELSSSIAPLLTGQADSG